MSPWRPLWTLRGSIWTLRGGERCGPRLEVAFLGRLEIGDFSMCFSRFLSFGLPCGTQNVAWGASGRQLWGPGWPPWETFPRFVRVYFLSAFRDGFLRHFSNIFPTFSTVSRRFAPGRRQRRRRRRGGRLRLRALLGWDLLFLPSDPARPATSNEVRRIGYRLCRRPPTCKIAYLRQI